MGNGRDLLKEFEAIRSIQYNKNRKRKNESDRDYIIRKANNRCSYCRMEFAKKQLSVVKKDPQRISSKIKNGVCACRSCANEKGNMTDDEFRDHLRLKKKEMRKEVFENYLDLLHRVLNKYNHTCIYCELEYGKTMEGRKLTIDHKIPLSRGGTNDLKNLCSACEDHNFDKRDSTAEEYFNVIRKRKEEASLHTVN